MAKKPPHPYDRITGEVSQEGVCQWCHGSQPGKRGFRHSLPFGQVIIGCHHVSRKDCRWSPLFWLFISRRFSENAGMNWLQDRGHISDNCVGIETVALEDVKDVLRKAGAEWMKDFLK